VQAEQEARDSSGSFRNSAGGKGGGCNFAGKDLDARAVGTISASTTSDESASRISLASAASARLGDTGSPCVRLTGIAVEASWLFEGSTAVSGSKSSLLKHDGIVRIKLFLKSLVALWPK